MKTVLRPKSTLAHAGFILFLPLLFLFYPCLALSEETGGGFLTPDDKLKDELKELKRLEARASVLNLFNKDYTAPTGMGELPDDMPMPGINFFFELRYTF